MTIASGRLCLGLKLGQVRLRLAHGNCRITRHITAIPHQLGCHLLDQRLLRWQD